MFVTTAGRTDEKMIVQAKRVAEELQVEYVPRKKRSISAMQKFIPEKALVVGKERLELFSPHSPDPFFFHPNSAMFRIKRLMNGESDPLIEATELKKGMSFLDCTLGLGSDSIVASFVCGGNGIVKGLEAQNELAYITKEGLKNWDSGLEEINECLRKIQVIHEDSAVFLKELGANSFDVVYFDPMFETNIEESDGIRGLSHFAYYEEISQQMINDAIRVAKKRVVLKDHFRSERFEKYNFQVNKRKSAKFHFGYIQK